MNKVNSEVLARCIELCVDLSMDGRLTREEQKEYLTQAKRLRALLLNLITARFVDGAQELLEANGKIVLASQQLNIATKNLEKTAESLEQLAELVGILDGLLAVATKFV